MAHLSNAERKARNLGRVNMRGQLLLAESKAAFHAKQAQEEFAKRMHVVRVLIAVVSILGDKGVVMLAADKVNAIPDSVRLQEYFDKESGALMLATVMDEPSPVEVVQPPIHLVGDGDDAV